jgi:hypothetical protein
LTREDLAKLHLEVYRSRRYGRKLAVVGVALGVDHLVRVRQALRAVDDVWTDGRQLYVLLPECDREGAEGLARRLESLDLGGARIVKVAVFPDDELTCEALIVAVTIEGEALRPVGRSQPVDPATPAVKATVPASAAGPDPDATG